MNEESLPPPSPEESLRLIDQQRAIVTDRLQGNLAPYYVPWGLAWLAGFGAFVLRDGIGDAGGYVSMPYSLPLIILFVAMAIAIAVTVTTGYRESNRVTGESTRTGVLYGLSWFLTFATMMPIASRFADLLPRDERGLLFAAVGAGLTGTLYLTGAAIWRNWGMAALGAWLLLVNLAGVLAGPAWHSIVMAVAGGGGMLVVGVGAWRRGRRARP